MIALDLAAANVRWFRATVRASIARLRKLSCYGGSEILTAREVDNHLADFRRRWADYRHWVQTHAALAAYSTPPNRRHKVKLRSTRKRAAPQSQANEVRR